MQAARKKTERSTPDAKSESANDRWLSLYQAADLLGESRTKVLTRIAHRELESDLVAGRTVVSRESVERVLATKGEQG